MEKSLAYKPQSIWENADSKARKEMESLAQRYIEFLTHCKTERETVEYVRQRLAENGYSEDFSGERVMRNLRGKAIFAARKGALPLSQGLSLLAAHADTPRLDFKQRPLIEQPGVAQAKTHYYGGIRKYQWLARPLALHGVIVRENGETVTVTIGERGEQRCRGRRQMRRICRCHDLRRKSPLFVEVWPCDHADQLARDILYR